MHAIELDPETFCNRHLPALVDLALSRNVSLAEAEVLAHEVLLSSFLNLSKIANIDTWLAGAIRSAIRQPEWSMTWQATKGSVAFR
jgi:DNA-directed RNA polymerase specialized sigma24 family protein